MVIYKEKDNTLAKLDIKGGRSLKTTLNVAQIDSFNLFIKELKLIKGEGCTTEETFIIQFNDEVINKVIRNCEWNGFFRLKQLLFLGK